MTPLLWTVAVTIGVILFGAGWIGGRVWKLTETDHDRHERRLNLGISLFFLVVAVITASSMVSIVYAHQRQVTCNTNLVAAIAARNQALLHVHIDAISYDTAMLALLDDVDRTDISDQERQRAIDALTQLIEARRGALKIERENPLPHC